MEKNAGYGLENVEGLIRKASERIWIVEETMTTPSLSVSSVEEMLFTYTSPTLSSGEVKVSVRFTSIA